VIVKRRNLGSEQIADLANLYFRMADIPIRFWSKVNEWRRWEINCFRMLNGDRFQANFRRAYKLVLITTDFTAGQMTSW